MVFLRDRAFSTPFHERVCVYVRCLCVLWKRTRWAWFMPSYYYNSIVVVVAVSVSVCMHIPRFTMRALTITIFVPLLCFRFPSNSFSLLFFCLVVFVLFLFFFFFFFIGPNAYDCFVANFCFFSVFFSFISFFCKWIRKCPDVMNSASFAICLTYDIFIFILDRSDLSIDLYSLQYWIDLHLQN